MDRCTSICMYRRVGVLYTFGGNWPIALCGSMSCYIAFAVSEPLKSTLISVRVHFLAGVLCVVAFSCRCAALRLHFCKGALIASLAGCGGVSLQVRCVVTAFLWGCAESCSRGVWLRRVVCLACPISCPLPGNLKLLLRVVTSGNWSVRLCHHLLLSSRIGGRRHFLPWNSNGSSSRAKHQQRRQRLILSYFIVFVVTLESVRKAFIKHLICRLR
jgi:hypothetical protein